MAGGEWDPVAGDTLASATFIDKVSKQCVIITTAAHSGLTGREGMTVMETDTDYAQNHDGTNWVPLGQYARSWTFIAEVQRGSDGAITFSSIPQTFTDLLVVANVRAASANANLTAGIRFNNDGTSIYDDIILTGTNATPTAANNPAASSGSIGKVCGNTAAASKASALEVLIPDYRSTTFHKNALGRGGLHDPGVAAILILAHATWRNTAAITQIDLWDQTGAANSWKTGSRATLLGRR